MPFISKDWRSPGEEWVKTREGWEKKKILECGRHLLLSQTENTNTRIPSIGNYERDERKIKIQRVSSSHVVVYDECNKENMELVDDQENLVRVIQPHCQVVIKCTREIAGFNGLSDAFKRLDFRNAVHDVRRFNYICKLLDLLITHKLSMLSGCAQKVLFNMLEEVAYQVSISQQNIHMLNKLLNQLRVMIDCACWGRPLGSTLLWESHLRTINRILTIANGIVINEPGDDVYPKIENLPEECIREILLRLADHKDLESSRKAYSVMSKLVNEQRIWRELCQFHFTQQQINSLETGTTVERDGKNDVEGGQKNWQNIYHKLRKSYGLREEYAEMIQLCRNCNCLFWKSIGHPCIADQNPGFQEKLEDVDKSSLHIPIPPQAFLKFFSL
ncbi:F-box only protein, putative [Pediculus humanus corporis]|uniref:F-box only protein, putative n=1 Tax=Pediculus humanus subsp. corporis TaxID=121224 RepID=E0W101_PEDHC|nr:F-box only protein, putative [Pediculus humanus corporis]EEB19306.1 F-box only protein, putative [Pediculus humanus corporis]